MTNHSDPGKSSAPLPLGEEEVASLSAALLQKFDTDKTGRLNKQQFVAAANALKIHPSAETVKYGEEKKIPVYEAMFEVGASVIGYSLEHGIGVAHVQAFISMHPQNLVHARAIAAGQPLPPQKE
eukprot:Hpha_TRINITY_DN3738_c0_g1::TRINITY_DN3738_c0_g1_i1::g.23891::m.23891